MKIKRIMLFALAVLPLIVSVIALLFLPEQIPVHFGTNFAVDRYGSKFEILILPIEIIFMSLIFLLPGIFIQEENNKKMLLNLGVALTLVFNALDYYILYIQSTDMQSLKTGVFSFERILLLIFGMFFIYIGNFMPMLRKNSFFGLRTKWSMENDTIWKKCQLFGGVSMMILGVIYFITAFVFPNIILMLSLLICVVVVDTVYTYIAFKKYSNAENQ